MEICVCVKQVPDIRDIKIDRKTNNLIREGGTNVINPFDEYALKAALMLKEKFGGSINVITMGPGSAKRVLADCIAQGADEAYLITGNEFAGADTLATSYTLSMGIRSIENTRNKKFDLIICGQQTIDGETAQVGAELAEMLSISQVTGVYEICMEDSDECRIVVKRGRDLGYEKLSAALPLLLTVSKMKEALAPPSVRAKIKASGYAVNILDKTSISGLDTERCGMSGSATKVRQTYVIDNSIEDPVIFTQLNDAAEKELERSLENILHLFRNE